MPGYATWEGLCAVVIGSGTGGTAGGGVALKAIFRSPAPGQASRLSCQVISGVWRSGFPGTSPAHCPSERGMLTMAPTLFLQGSHSGGVFGQPLPHPGVQMIQALKGLPSTGVQWTLRAAPTQHGLFSSPGRHSLAPPGSAALRLE